jgi:uncharacterized protein YacL
VSARRRPAAGVVEVLRLFVVLFFAGIGYQVGSVLARRAHVLGPFDGVAVGVIVGSGVGFVLGGVLGRSTVSAVDSAEAALRDLSAEGLVAGIAGAVVGVVLGSAVAWPLFLIRQALIAVPLFCFVVAVVGLLGQRLAVSRQQGVIRLIGASAGKAAPAAPSLLPRILDTSVAVDGRILDIAQAGFLHGNVLVPQAVIGELQRLADSADAGVRARGRRGLDVLARLKREPGIVMDVLDDDPHGPPDVDAQLVRACLDRGCALLTLDTNLAKAAALTGVHVLNLQALALALRPSVTAGESIEVALLKAGKEAGQAVGYLDDGTMVVVEQARRLIGREVAVRVGSVLVTANGRLVFAQLVDPAA